MRFKTLHLIPTLLLLVLISLSNIVTAQTVYTVDGLQYQISDDGTYAILLGPQAGTSVVWNNPTIPGIVEINNSSNYYPVKVIDFEAFKNCTGLTGTLTLPSHLVLIRPEAFKGCTGLTAVKCNATEPPTVGTDSFSGVSTPQHNVPLIVNLNCASNYMSSYWVYGFTDISEDNTFIYNDFEMAVNDDGNTLTLRGSIWEDHISGTLNIPSSVAYGGHTYTVSVIGDWAFYDCWYLSGALTIPNSVTTIGEGAFGYCVGFTQLQLGSGLTMIGNSAFYMSNHISSVVSLASTPPTLGGKYVFFRLVCDALEVPAESIAAYEADQDWRYFFPEVTSIGSVDLFQDGDLIFRHIHGQNTATVVHSETVSSWANDFTIPATASFEGNTYIVNAIGSYAFYYDNFSGSLNIPLAAKIGKYAFYGCTINNTLTLGNSVETIDDYAFAYGHAYSVVSMASNPPSLGDGAFYLTYGLYYLEVPSASVEAYRNSDWKDYFQLIGPLGQVNEATVNDLVYIYIPDYDKVALKGHVQGTSVTGTLNIPSTVSINGENRTVSSIAYRAFSGCHGLTGSLVIPNTVTTIGHNAFINCDGFNGSLILGNSVETIGVAAFRACSGFTGYLLIPGSVREIGFYSFELCTGFNRLIIEDGVQNISDCTFNSCTGLTGDILIPNSVKTIGYQAFGQCTGFDGTLTIGSNVETIGWAAFEGCTGLTAVVTKAVVPPTLHATWGAFSQVPVTTLTVPCGCTSAYQASAWSDHFTSFVEDCSAVETVEDNTSSVYPNPTNGIVNIEAENIKNIVVFNTLGQKVFETVENQINLSQFGTGLFMMRIETGNGSSVQRIMVR